MKETIEKLANEMNLPAEVVKEAYTSSWRFIKETISELPLKDSLTEE